MPASQSPKMAGRRSRKSIAHLPMPSLKENENNTIQGFGSKEREQKGVSRKTRSKSLGPGGLEALNESSGNRQKVTPIIKSILKPTIPLSPPKQIPPRNKPEAQAPAPDVHGPQTDGPESQSQREPTNVSNHEASEQALSEEQREVAAREKEKQEILERRDARRKSLANRRVSFAPEATLHTWDIVELPEDATSSSEATNSTRRASSGSTLQSPSFTQNPSSFPNSDPPSTPPKAEVQVAASPAHQRDLHQKKHRRSSGIPPMNFNNPEDFSSSPMGSVGSDDTRQSLNATEVIDGSEMDSDEDKDTIRELTITATVNEDLTAHSEPSPDSDKVSSTSSSARLDNSLREAAERVGAQSMQRDETGDVSMDLIDNDASKSLMPLEQQDPPKPAFNRNLTSLQDQENINPFSPVFAAHIQDPSPENETEMTMEMTRAVGGIMQPDSKIKKPSPRGRRKSMPSSRRRSSVGRRRSSGGSSTLEDETMEFATAYGGIQQLPKTDAERAESDSEDEEMTMELTTVMGGVVQPMNSENAALQENSSGNSFLHANEADMDMDMDITTAVGRVLSPVTERTEPSEDGTMGMDITNAVGSILPKDLKASDKSTAKLLMEEEADHGQLTRSPFIQPGSPSKTRSLNQKSFTATATGSPEAVQTRSQSSQPPVGALKLSTTPTKTPGTPSKQLTPQPVRPTTPSKTPPSRNVSMRRTSPKKLFKAEIKKAASKSPKASTPNLKFSKDIKTGQAIPDVVLTPPVRRRVSGVGIDQDGMGSPRVAAILDRRASIMDSSEKFAPQQIRTGVVRFEDPQIMEQEIDNERAEDERRESGRGVLQLEADNAQEEDTKDLTTNLKDMIQSLTPKKNRLKGRKSLAGSAKGLLGKRPIELDEEDDEDLTPKRLKGKERSPVKSIHLPGPLSKDGTLGFLGKAPRFGLTDISGNVSTPVTEMPPEKTASTPKDHDRFKDAEAVKARTVPPPSFNEQLSGASPEVDNSEEVPISLQEFLNMTNIRFMDLTTTKRRPTVAPSNDFKSEGTAENGLGLADCVATGAVTIPMLDLFQHSCRELKKYISEGKSVVREIEKDTLDENPPLFREYMSAAPEVRAIMDNQFKNIKAHARGESKRTWYEWRSKLFDGLKKGLVSIHEGMIEDDKILIQQEELLRGLVPELVERHAKLKAEAETMQAQADELANCDQDELRETRARLIAKEEEIGTKKKLIAELQEQLQQKERSIEQVKERTSECQAEIQEAERVANDNRGWSYAEVKVLKEKVDAIESRTGWTLHTCTTPHVTYAYKKTLFLFSAPSHASKPPSLKPDLPISLTYNPPEGLYRPSLSGEPPITHRFFTQLLQARLPALPHARPLPSMKSVLDLIRSGWDLASRVYDETARVRSVFATDEKILSDDTLLIQSMILLRAPSGVRRAQTKVHAQFFVCVFGEGTEVGCRVDVKTEVVYGESFGEEKMRQFVLKRVKAEDGMVGIGGWREALEELKGALVRREVESLGRWREGGCP